LTRLTKLLVLMNWFFIFHFQVINFLSLWIIDFIAPSTTFSPYFTIKHIDFFLQLFWFIIQFVALLKQLLIHFFLVLIIFYELVYIINISLYFQLLKYHFIFIYIILDLLSVTFNFLSNLLIQCSFRRWFLHHLIILIPINPFQYFTTVIQLTLFQNVITIANLIFIHLKSTIIFFFELVHFFVVFLLDSTQFFLCNVLFFVNLHSFKQVLFQLFFFQLQITLQLLKYTIKYHSFPSSSINFFLQPLYFCQTLIMPHPDLFQSIFQSLDLLNQIGQLTCIRTIKLLSFIIKWFLSHFYLKL